MMTGQRTFLWTQEFTEFSNFYALKKLLHIDAISSNDRDRTKAQLRSVWHSMEACGAAVKFNVFAACRDYGESREKSRSHGQKMVCEAYADHQGAYPVWSSRFASLTSVYICLFIVTREPTTMQAQCTTTSPAEARTIHSRV
jgi:hypothetical protein